MLPTAGYFRGIACPLHEKSYCHRPYCHFRHNPKKDTTSYSPQRPTSKTDVEGDETDSTNEASMDLAACSTTTVITENESPEKPPLEEGQEGPSVTHEEEDQSDLLQQLVSEAVKKVLAENPILASSGVDPSTIMKSIDTSALIAQAAQVNAKAKKKFYFRPPDTPKYNPTPIEELNKRKRSADYSEDSFAPKAKIGKYTPTPISTENTVVDSAEVGPGSKEEADGEITDFSSDEDEDQVDKRRCDFDILEEVLAEHSQNNKIKVKKKKGKALGKLQYSLSIPEKNVDESAMISDARNMSDQDSNTCDTLRISSEAKVPTEESYFLPPSPIFTSSSDGFGAFSSIVYAKSCTSPEECESSSNIILSDKNVTTSPGATSNAEESNTVKQLEPHVKVDKKIVAKDDTKRKIKGHIHLPQVVHTLGAPKLIRPNIRNWTPHVRSNMSDSRKDGDPLEEMLELMDGNDAAAQEESKGNSRQSPASGGQEVASTKKTHKYKVDLDKEIESLTNSPSKRDESTSHDRLDSAKKDLDKQVEDSESNNNAQEIREATQVNIEKTKPNQNKEIKTNACETNNKKHMKEKETNSENDPLDNQSDKSNNDSVDKCKQSEERIESQDKRCLVNKGKSTENKTKAVEKSMNKHTKEKNKNSKSDPLDNESEEEFNNDDAVDKGVPTEDTSDSEKEQTKRKRKRKHSYTSSSDSDHFHHRKKRKKSHKRNRKHNRTKKRRKRKNSRSDSSDSDEESEKDGKDTQDSKDTKDKDSKDAADSKANEKCESSGEGHKEEEEEEEQEDIVKLKKHKKHKKKSKHRRKLKHKRKKKKLKSKKKGGKNSSSSSRSRSSSRDRSRSSSRSRSRSSSVHKSRSLSREGRRSSRKNKKRSSNQHRSRSASQNRSRSSSQNRSRSSSKDISRSSSKLRSKSSSIHRSRSSSIHRSRRSNDHRSRSSSTQRSSSSDHRSSSGTHRSPSKHRDRTTSKSRNKGSSKHSSSNKHRSRSTSKQRSRSLSKNRSHSSSKSSVNKSQSISRSGKPETRKNSNANTKNKSNKSSKESAYMENSQPLSTPMPVDPSKIKMEVEELVPDLSIVKTEKVDEEFVDAHSKKKDLNSIEDANQRQNYVNDKSMYSSNHRSSSGIRKESESYRKKDKEQMKLSSNADSKRRNSHERKNSTESISEKTLTSIRRSSSDSKKSETDISSDKKKADRRPSTDKMKKDKVSNSSTDSQPKVMSMFDMVLANTQTPKPKAFTEISIFDSVCDNYDANTDSSAVHSEDEMSPGDSHSNVMQEPSPHKKSSQSHSNSKSKAESASTTEKIIDRQRSEVTNPPRRKSRSYSNSSSRDGRDDSKRSHSSSTKHKSNSFNHDVNTDSSLSSSEDETNHKGSYNSKTQEPSTNKKSYQCQSNGKSKAESGSKTENTSGHQRPEGISHSRSSRSHSNSSSKDGKDEAIHPHSSSTKHKSSSYNYDGNSDSSVSPFEDETNHRGSRNSRTQESSTNKKSQSQSDAKSKIESGPRTDNTSDHQRPEGKTHLRLSRTHSNSSSKDESKHSHSSASKHNASSHHRSSNHHSSSGSHIRGSGTGSSSSKAHQSSTTTSSSSSSKSKRKESRSESSSNQSSKSSKHHQSSKKSSSNKHNSSSSINKHESTIGNKEKGYTNADAKKSGMDSKVDEATTSKHPQGQEESSSGISDRESFFYNDTGNESPLPYLSELDEITLDDLEEMMSSSDKVDLRHLENLEDSDDNDRYELDKDDPEVMEECLKMYNEYQPTQEDLKDHASSKKGRLQSVNEEPDHQGKQRIARTDSCGNLIAKKPLQRKKTPTQMMMERYQKLKEQKAKYAELSRNQKQQQRVGESSAMTLKSHPSSSTLLMSPPNSSPGGLKRRISHVPNVSSLLHARERIKNLPPPSSRTLLSPSVAKASGAIPQTTVQTAKGGKRIAHVPRTETLARPIIPAEFGSKVPQNIRQRYLNSLIDECLKFTGEKDAFNIAAAEEHTCYKRASSRMVYLNLTVNAIKRLRTQQKAGEAAQELLDKDPQFADHLFVEETSSSVQPSTSSAASSQGIGAKSNPTNLNQVKLSHFTVLAGGGQRGSWSIEKPKKSTNDFQEYLKGEAFYKLMMKYVLSSEHLEQNGYPLPDPDVKGKAITKAVDTRKKISPSSVERYCARCSALYMIDKWGFPTSVGPCVHHWGRAYKRRTYSGFEARYSCCGGDLESEGCCQATTHVSENYNPNELHGYVRTLPKEIKGNDPGVYALDCEMCYTTGGNELTRVTVINVEGNTVYEHLVKPENPIIDYNTRFSGITEGDMVDVKTTILDVQAALLTLFSDKTILVGHSLESDFHALKLIHDTVVDTSVVFPHKMGPPYKRALRNLASEYLKTIIQNDVSGHDSAEDALTCMQLMQWRIKEDLKGLK